MNEDLILGVDVGGTGIKGAIVDVHTGQLVTERHRIPTPKPATPQAVAETFAAVTEHFQWTGKVGCGFPSILKNGVCHSAANIDKSWIGTNVEELFQQESNCLVSVCNDADVAGLAELQFGAGKDKKDVVILLTIGTGIGSAMFINGELVPNTELGHLYLKKHKLVAEKYTSNYVRKTEDLEWDEWAKRFNQYLKHVERLFTPDLLILGGGGSKKFDNFSRYLDINTEIVPAQMLNNAGIIGAAVLGSKIEIKDTVKVEKV